jgi:hypothetical protein
MLIEAPRRRRRHIHHANQIELAQEIIRHARRRGVRFEWVGMDGMYGYSLESLTCLHSEGETFIADVHSIASGSGEPPL